MANIGRYGGKVTVEAGSSPTGHTIHMTSNQSWLKVYQDNQSTAIASAGTNTDADDRSATVSITATTVSDPSYEGTASVTCGWTVTQAGTGSTPIEKFVTLNLNCTNNNGNARVPEMQLNVYGDDSGDGPEIFNSARRKYDNVWPLTDRSTVGDSDYITVVITASNGGSSEYNGTYTYNYGLGTPTTSGTVTVDSMNPVEICNITIPISSVENTFYIEMYDPSYN